LTITCNWECAVGWHSTLNTVGFVPDGSHGNSPADSPSWGPAPTERYSERQTDGRTDRDRQTEKNQAGYSARLGSCCCCCCCCCYYYYYYLLQSDISHTQGWCSANYLKLKISKTRVNAFTRKTNVLYYSYKICDSFITRADTIKELGVQLDSKLHFHAHADYIFSQSVRMLGLIRTVTYSFTTLDSLLTLYLPPVRPKLEYASIVWNCITATDAEKPERIQRSPVSKQFFYSRPCYLRRFS
jgi:hypothetical protein